MKTNLITLATIVLFLSVGCGKFKKEKKEATNNQNTVENVQDYSDPVENDYENDVNFNDSTKSNTSLSGEVDYSTYASDSTDEANNAISEEPETNSTNTTNTTVTNEATTGTEYTVFYIVGGSFTDINKAKRLNSQFNKEGTNSYVASPVNGFNRVIMGKYYRKKEALKDLVTFRKRYQKLRFWLLGGN